MRIVSTPFWKMCRATSGATAVEFAIICVPLVLLCLGTVELGRALNVRNDLAFAADAGARTVLIGQDEEGAVEQAIRAAFIGSDQHLVVTIGSEIINQREFRTVDLDYPLTFMLPGLGGRTVALSLSRRVPIH